MYVEISRKTSFYPLHIYLLFEPKMYILTYVIGLGSELVIDLCKEMCAEQLLSARVVGSSVDVTISVNS